MEENIICRLCLDVVPTGYTVLDENIQNTVKILTSIDVSIEDSLPKISCAKCIFNLYFIENVRNLIIKSDEKLRTVIERDGNWNELLIINKPTIPEEDEECNDPDNIVNVEIKEEKYHPPNPIEADIPDPEPDPDMFSEQCDNSAMSFGEDVGDVEDMSEDTGIGDIFEENDIKKIIYRKDNIKPYLYHCRVCRVDFRGNKQYTKHKGKHMKKTCEICGITTRQDNFSKHMTKHKLGQQICDMCGSIHKSLEGLRTHLFHFHNDKKKLYTCGECGEAFKYSHRLSYHKRKVHTGFRPHQCDTCGKRFFDLGTMKKHVKLIHLKLREYPCKYCHKDYSSRYALKVHIRQHTDETPYVCEICTEGFRQLVSLKTHMAKHERMATKRGQGRKKGGSQQESEELKVEDIFT